jgi:hypothetical protein
MSTASSKNAVVEEVLTTIKSVATNEDSVNNIQPREPKRYKFKSKTDFASSLGQSNVESNENERKSVSNENESVEAPQQQEKSLSIQER